MAGDWIPMRLDLYEDPAVIQMATEMDVREELIVGYLHKIWSWMSRQMRDNRVTGVTLQSLGRVTGLKGFPELMRDVGWLIEVDGCIEVPNFDRWLGETAKKRLTAAKRQKKSRESRNGVALLSRSERDKSVTKSVTTGQDRTGENIHTPPPPKSATLLEPASPKWGGVESLLAACGVGRSTALVAEVRRRTTVDRVEGLVSVWRTYHVARGWGAGILHDRIRGDRPELAEMDGWPNGTVETPPASKPKKSRSELRDELEREITYAGKQRGETDEAIAAVLAKKLKEFDDSER